MTNGPVKWPLSASRLTGEAFVTVSTRPPRPPRLRCVVGCRVAGGPRGSAPLGERPRVPDDAPRGLVELELVDLGAGGVDGAAAEPALHGADREVGAAELGPVGPGRLGGEPHPEVARDRVEATGVDDAGTGALGGLVVGGDAAVHEEHLSGEVAVVRTGVGARGGQRHAVLHVRTDRRDDDPSAVGQLGDRPLVRGVDHEQWPALRGGPELTGHLGQPGQRATRERDAHLGVGLGGEVSGGEPPDEPRGTEQDDVELTRTPGHPPTLGVPT